MKTIRILVEAVYPVDERDANEIRYAMQERVERAVGELPDGYYIKSCVLDGDQLGMVTAPRIHFPTAT